MAKTKKSSRKVSEYKCTRKGCTKTCKTKAGLIRHREAHDRKPKAKPRGKLKPLKKRQADAITNKGKAQKKQGNNKHVNEANLSAEDELFCELFASDKELFGNGVQSYIEAYDITVVKGKSRGETDDNEKTYEACKQAAHHRLTSTDFLKRINEIFEGRGLNDQFVDKQLEKVITQDAEFNPKVRAIQEYNKLKKRTVERLEHVHSFAKYEKMTDDEIQAEIEKGEEFFLKK